MLPSGFDQQLSRLNLNVSRETIGKLQTYHDLLVKWQKSINLVAPSTIEDAWQRHFLDSIQMVPHIESHVKSLVDIGSGAGFPGLIIAIMRPDIKVTCIESDQKKCQFLKTVSRETMTKLNVVCDRIEKCYDVISGDLLTARALASLDKLLAFQVRLSIPKGLYLKGEMARQELDEALKSYDFDADQVESITQKTASILKISNLKACG